MGRSAKDKDARQQRLILELKGNHTIRISEMAREFGVSTETIRRDLEELDRTGKVARTYGGAVAKMPMLEPGWNERHMQMRGERAAIGQRTAALVKSGDVLMIDAGSTVQHLADALVTLPVEITVVTNGVTVATTLAANPSISVMLCPGVYQPRDGCALGTETVDFIGRFNATMAIVGASGLTTDGPSDASAGLAAVKRAMFARSRQRLLIADHGKFDQSHLSTVCPLSELTMVVVDQPPSGPLDMALRQAGVEVLIS